jgi:tRNA pseudouridine55 synthase
MQDCEPKPISGVIVLDKPKNVSSAWYVYLLRPVLAIRRIGHAGTLDPIAEGVLLACVNQATKCFAMLSDLPKRYQVTVQLGVTNSCYDLEQPAEPYPNPRIPTCNEVCRTLQRFCGEILQVPPAFSAVMVDGVRAYDLARKARQVHIRPRPVRIYSLDLKEYRWPCMQFEVLCGQGTYIRALVRDIGEILACGAVCTHLRRGAVGPFDTSRAIRIRGMTRQQIEQRIIPVPQVEQMLAAYNANRPIPPAPA